MKAVSRYECLQSPDPCCPHIYVRDNQTREIVDRFLDLDLAKNVHKAKVLAASLNLKAELKCQYVEVAERVVCRRLEAVEKAGRG